MKKFLTKLSSFKNIIAIYIMVFIPILAKIGVPDLVLIILSSYLVFYLPTNFKQKELWHKNPTAKEEE